MIKEFEVQVIQTVKVSLDEEKLTDEFNEAFSEVFFYADCLEDHAEHLAQMEARSLIGFDKFVEGYGDLRDLNCKVVVTDQEVEVNMIAK